MLKENRRFFRQLHIASDIGLTASAFGIAYYTKKFLLSEPFRGLSASPDYSIVFLLVMIIWYLVFTFTPVYRSYRNQSVESIFVNLIKALALSTLILVSLLFVFKIEEISRIFIGLFIFIDLFLLSISKGFIHFILRYCRKKGYNFRNIIVVGSKLRAVEVINAIQNHPEAGYRIIGCLETSPEWVGAQVIEHIHVIGTVDDFENVFKEKVIDEIIIALPVRYIPDFRKFIDFAENIGITVHILPQWDIQRIGYAPKIGLLCRDTILGFPCLSLVSSPIYNPTLIVKTVLDYSIAIVCIFVMSGPSLLIAAAIRLSSPGPLIYRQKRVGLNGRIFTLYKFRTMQVDAENWQSALLRLNEVDGPVFKMKRDPRIIPYVGTFLRKTGMDELPQLINVLKGEMSIVGPRPPLLSEVEKYAIWHRRRLSMKPGLTCLWQVSPKRNDLQFNEWIRMDLEYIDRWSLKLDIYILFRTFVTILTAEGR